MKEALYCDLSALRIVTHLEIKPSARREMWQQQRQNVTQSVVLNGFFKLCDKLLKRFCFIVCLAVVSSQQLFKCTWLILRWKPEVWQWQISRPEGCCLNFFNRCCKQLKSNKEIIDATTNKSCNKKLSNQLLLIIMITVLMNWFMHLNISEKEFKKYNKYMLILMF